MTLRGKTGESGEARMREALLRETAGAPASIWPACSEEIADDSPLFRIAFLGPEWINRDAEVLRAGMSELLRQWGRTRRHYRNALAFAAPDHDRFDAALRKQQDPSNLDASALAAIYPKLWMPCEPSAISGAPEFEEIEVRTPTGGGGKLFESCVDSLGARVRHELAPAELERILGLGEKDCSGIFRALFPAREAARWFFCFLGLPRFMTPEPIERCVRAGVESGQFGLLLPDVPRLLALDQFERRQGDRVIFDESAGEWRGFDHPGAYLVWRGALDRAGR